MRSDTFLLKGGAFGSVAFFHEGSFKGNSGLANDLGNLLSRTVAMNRQVFPRCNCGAEVEGEFDNE